MSVPETALRLLYMEDDPGLGRLVQKRLRRENWSVDLAEDGERGLALLAEGAYDILLLDHEMPVLSGLRVIELLASENRLPPTIMLTGTGDEQTAVEAMKLGVGDYLVKDAAGAYLELLPSAIWLVLERSRLRAEKQKAEEALRESEERFRLMVENTHDIIYTLTADGVFVFVSPAWTTLLGHPVTQVAGQPFQEFVHPDDLPGCMAFLRAVVELGTRQEGVEYRVQHIDGTWYWHTSSAVPLRDEGGTIVGFYGIARDITERKRVEDELRASEARFRAVAETAADAIICSDRADRVFLWNRAAEGMFGYTEGEALGMSARALFSDPSGAPLPKGTDAPHFESLGCRKDGGLFPVEVSVTDWATGHETHRTTIVRDVSERKEYEDKLAYMAHHDSLTGAFNRHHLSAVLETETARAERYKHPIGFLMIDVNRFKMINDTFGHRTGDRVVQAVAHVLLKAVRRADLVFRYGGDEFLVVLPETNGSTRFVKDHILAAIEQWNKTNHLLDFDVTLSIGVAHWAPGCGKTTDEALNEADAAMYREKRASAAQDAGGGAVA
jgi:diguanylate cyclase (GGDEF)-like protein/PAS domain S-box-containing protein